MKTLLLIAIFFAQLAQSAPTNLLSLQYIGGTSNGGVYYASNIYIPRQRFLFQTLGITNGGYAGSYTTNGITNAVTVNIQISVDASNTNWVTLATWTPNHTNAVVDSFDEDLDLIALPIRAQVITTNAIGVSVFKQ